LLRIPAILHERLFQRGDLAVEEEIRLVDEADRGIRADRRVAVLQPAAVKAPALLVGEIRLDQSDPNDLSSKSAAQRALPRLRGCRAPIAGVSGGGGSLRSRGAIPRGWRGPHSRAGVRFVKKLPRPDFPRRCFAGPTARPTPSGPRFGNGGPGTFRRTNRWRPK
jgi:hypothetical protein